MTSTAGTVIALALSTIALTACGTSEIGQPYELDADDVAAYSRRDGFTVPDGFTFAEAHTFSEFVGQAPWSARYDAPVDLGDGKAVTAANPTFPPMAAITCSAVPPGNWSSLGFDCGPGTLVTQYPPSREIDTVTALLTRDERGASSFLYSSGH